MINHTELRIGNTIRGMMSDEPVTVKGITDYNDEPIIVTYGNTDGELCFEKYREDEVDPISLTSDILKGLGFIETTGGLSTTKSSFNPKSGVITIVFKEKGRYGLFMWYDYTEKNLHQLQNLFYNLSGEELIFKTPS